MTYATLSHWTTTEWTEDLEDIARHTFVPMILKIGAQRVEMIRTGAFSFTVVTHYADEAAATAAGQQIAALRAKAADELPMSMDSASAGEVFASS